MEKKKQYLNEISIASDEPFPRLLWEELLMNIDNFLKTKNLKAYIASDSRDND